MIFHEFPSLVFFFFQKFKILKSGSFLVLSGCFRNVAHHFGETFRCFERFIVMNVSSQAEVSAVFPYRFSAVFGIKNVCPCDFSASGMNIYAVFFPVGVIKKKGDVSKNWKTVAK